MSTSTYSGKRHGDPGETMCIPAIPLELVHIWTSSAINYPSPKFGDWGLSPFFVPWPPELIKSLLYSSLETSTISLTSGALTGSEDAQTRNSYLRYTENGFPGYFFYLISLAFDKVT